MICLASRVESSFYYGLIRGTMEHVINQVELVVDGITGVLARLRSDLRIGAALASPGGNVGVAAARELGAHAAPGRQCRDGA